LRETFGPEGSKPGLAGDPLNSISEERRTCESVWSTAGSPYNGERRKSKFIGESGDISSLVSNAAPGVARRLPIASPVSRDVPDPRRAVYVVVWPSAQAAPRSSVQADDRIALGFASVQEG